MIQLVFFEYILALCSGMSGLTVMVLQYRMRRTPILRDMLIYNGLCFLSILIYGVGTYSILFGFVIPQWYGPLSIPLFLALACLRFIFIVRLAFGLVGARASVRRLTVIAVSLVSLAYACADVFLVLAGQGDAWKAYESIRSALKDIFVIVPVLGCSLYLLAKRRAIRPSVHGLCVASTVICIAAISLYALFALVRPDACRQYVDMPMIVFFVMNGSYTAFFLLSMRFDGAEGRVGDKGREGCEPSPGPRAYEDLAQSHGISKREYEIILLVAEGLSYATIGDRLFISPNTVRNHVYNAYRKLGIENKIQLYKVLVSATA